MSVSATSPDQEVRRLIGEGYDAALADGMLVVSHVPYVRGPGRIGRASLLVPLSMVAGRVSAPRTHQAWWTGKEPTEVDGRPLDGMKAHGSTTRCLEGLPPAIMICCKPRGREFRDHHEFVTTYVGLLGAPAVTLDPSVTARFRAPRTSPPTKEGPFAYLDTASPRAALGAVNARVKGRTVGIVGLGGTGSYVLDLVSKCSVDAIHLYDDDLLEQHSAFRAPGATTIDDLRARRTKVDHFASVYRGIHRHVMPHAIRIDGRTAAMLDPLDFVFLCIDDAAAKPPIIERLARRAIPYVDVGMGLHLTDRGIAGAIRTTFVEPGEHAVAESIPTVGDADGVYATNIQICELNALNAALAVVAWKRHLGFYASNRSQSNSVFVVEDGRLHTDERDAPLVSVRRASGAAVGACPEPDHEDEDA